MDAATSVSRPRAKNSGLAGQRAAQLTARPHGARVPELERSLRPGLDSAKSQCTGSAASRESCDTAFPWASVRE